MKKNKSFYKICATIINNNLNGLLEIIIEKEYKIYNLRRYDICVVESFLLKKVDEEIRHNILLYN